MTLSEGIGSLIMPPSPKPSDSSEPVRPDSLPEETRPLEESHANTDVPAAIENTTVPPASAEPSGTGPADSGSLVGQTFGDYELLEEVGRGGMGIVYKARQKSLERLVALKMLLSDQLKNPALLSRFLGEARTVAGLSHPNIVGVYQVGECSVGHYFVMEFIDGRSLESILRERTVPIPWAISLIIVVAEAVHYAHTRGVIHRDLKPANIMIDRFRRPVVLDFGIAKFLGKSSGLTQAGVVIGTPAYLPPEQAGEDASRIGPSSDVYSLGAILYTLLTGRPPFVESTPLRTILKVISPDPPLPLRACRADIPAELEQTCLKCLSKAPADRYPSAHALAVELRRVRAALGQKQGSLALGNTLPSVTLVARETGRLVRLFKEITVIGRTSECDITLRFPEVSKRHCRILLEPDQVVVEDLDSVNGTCVNGRQVKRIGLHHGDHLDVAGHFFEVRLQAPTRQSPGK
jgi:serine/threonine protein kinase